MFNSFKHHCICWLSKVQHNRCFFTFKIYNSVLFKQFTKLSNHLMFSSHIKTFLWVLNQKFVNEILHTLFTLACSTKLQRNITSFSFCFLTVAITLIGQHITDILSNNGHRIKKRRSSTLVSDSSDSQLPTDHHHPYQVYL